ncbi:Tannase/feruloyl esterase [Macrophomina phaseolina MS6]|uniref:Carboxylic ester hydrolase n=2 Tax=Macrophomina phaseolina TaxID=35725 RepID=K2SUJ4_MACPH|nr:Tannase/feruloyl esterase [Macrophomina phaseolina MS6]
MHGSVELAKKLTTAYYASDIKYSYYSGCSTGGRQGLRSAQLFPDDFDGVLAGAPAWWTTHLQTWTAKMGTYNLPLNGSNRIPPSLFTAIGAEVLKQCDGQDGLVDTIISDPRACTFNPDALLCSPTSTNTSTCLTPAQLDTLYKIYNPYVDTNNTFVFPGLALGSESQWTVLLGTPTGEPLSYGTDYIRYFLDLPSFQYQDFDYSIIQRADALDPGNATADAYDLRPFRARGGKLLHYHGWADALIATGSSIYFYEQVLRTLVPAGVGLDDWYRFFLVPGMQHCAGTPSDVNAPWYFAGANQAADLGTGVSGVPGFRDGRHDALLALMAWVEEGTVVEELVATKFVDEDVTKGVERQRPLCAYPKRAVYKGTGDVDSAESWECEPLY